MSNVRGRWILVTILVASVVAVGCRGTLPGLSTPRATATTDQTPGFCADWSRLATESSKFNSAHSSTPAKRTELKASVDTTTTMLRALSETAPTDIRPAIATYAQWWEGFSTALARVGYDFTRVSSDAELQQAVQATTSHRLTEASARIGKWVEQNCPK